MQKNSTLGHRIAELRSRRGWTQKKLAEQAGLSTPFLSEIENDKRNVSADVLLRIADALGASLDYLMRGERKDSVDREPLTFPPALAEAAEEQGWTYSETAMLLKTQQLVLARRSSGAFKQKPLQDWTSEDWIDFHRRLFNE